MLINTLPSSTLSVFFADKMVASGFDKFRLLMWKNWLLQWRHPLQTGVEIIAPVLFSALLVLIRSLVEPTSHLETTVFPEFQINNTLPINIQQPGYISLL